MRVSITTTTSPEPSGGFLKGTGYVVLAFALLFLGFFARYASGSAVRLHKSPEGVLCGRYEVSRPWWTSVRELPPGSVLGIRHVLENRRESASGGGRGGSPRSYTVQVMVLVVSTTGEEIRMDRPDASSFAQSVLASAPGGPLQSAEIPYPWGILAIPVGLSAFGALLVWLGRRKLRSPAVPPPA